MRKSFFIRMFALLVAGILLCLCMAGCKEKKTPSSGGNTGNQLGDEIILSAFWPPMEGFMTDNSLLICKKLVSICWNGVQIRFLVGNRR